MKFCSLSSGSSGNCQYIESKEAKILVDCGLTGKATQALLNSIGVDPRDLDGIFVTHEHLDHIKGLGIVSRKFNVPIYANGETWQAMEKCLGKVALENIREFSIDESFYFKDIYIKPVPLFHDAVNPNGFTFQTDQTKISLITDTGWVSNEIIESIADSDLYFLESNHDLEMLKKGFYPWALKQRVLSTRGHLSNDNCSEVVEASLKGRGEVLILSHLSVDNNTPELAQSSMEKTLDKMGIDWKIGACRLEIAPRFETSCVHDFRRK